MGFTNSKSPFHYFKQWISVIQIVIKLILYYFNSEIIFTNSNGEIFTITDLSTRGEEQGTLILVFESQLVVAVVLYSILSRAQNEKFSRRVVSLWTQNYGDNPIFSRSADHKLSIQVFIILLNSRWSWTPKNLYKCLNNPCLDPPGGWQPYNFSLVYSSTFNCYYVYLINLICS